MKCFFYVICNSFLILSEPVGGVMKAMKCSDPLSSLLGPPLRETSTFSAYESIEWEVTLGGCFLCVLPFYTSAEKAAKKNLAFSRNPSLSQRNVTLQYMTQRESSNGTGRPAFVTAFKVIKYEVKWVVYRGNSDDCFLHLSFSLR